MAQYTQQRKKVIHRFSPREEHWVGDGFFVSTIFSMSSQVYPMTTPFLLMDHAAPKEFDPSSQKRGVDEHPHRGFETVTFALGGEIEHRDSGGGGGTIGQGGVQWMTAGSGVVHEEKHSKEFSGKGGLFEMVQLWVNLPAKDKMRPPKYQSIDSSRILEVPLAQGRAIARLVAGSLEGKRGPAQTHTPMTMYELSSMKQGAKIELESKEGWNLLVFVLRGQAKINESDFNLRDLAVFSREGENPEIELAPESRVLVLTGEPIDEPIAAYGPFVMNTPEEIHEAIRDYQSGKMGRLVVTES